MDYGPVAGTYAAHRWALEWKSAPIRDAVTRAGSEPWVLDLGCGTGDYLADVHRRFHDARLFGCDRSPEMLARAGERCPTGRFVLADLDRGLPVRSARIGVAYFVDVFHHLREPRLVLRESHRVLRDDGRLCVISDSTDDIHARTLAKLFPETLAINLERYPPIEGLCEAAEHIGFRLSSRTTIRGTIAMDDRFLEALGSRAMSELRLISAEQHRAGMTRAREYASRGEGYVSQSTALTWIKP
jgi:SAM-dependent methyltransferase